jgi:hypothetical protein
MKLVNYTASFYEVLYEKIDSIDDLISKSDGSDGERRIEREIVNFIELHANALL